MLTFSESTLQSVTFSDIQTLTHTHTHIYTSIFVRTLTDMMHFLVSVLYVIYCEIASEWSGLQPNHPCYNFLRVHGDSSNVLDYLNNSPNSWYIQFTVFKSSHSRNFNSTFFLRFCSTSSKVRCPNVHWNHFCFGVIIHPQSKVSLHSVQSCN